MTKFTRMLTLAAVCIATTGVANASVIDPGAMPVAPEVAFQPDVILAQSRPPSGFNNNWYIAPNGCAYSRTGAPGSAPLWILIQNPHHLGLPDAHSGCANTL